MLNPIRRNAWFYDHAHTIRKVIIVLVCLLLAVVIGRPSLLEKLPLIVAGVIGLVVLLASAFKPDRGVILLLMITLFVPVGFSTGSQSPITLSLAFTLALAGAWITRMLVEHKRIQLLPSAANKPLIGFALAATFSLLWSNVVRDPFVTTWESFPRVQLGALSVMVLSPAAALLAANHLNTTRHFKIVVGIFIAAAALGLPIQLMHVDLPFPNMRGLFPLWAIAMTGGQALFNRSLSNRTRVILGGLALGWFAFQFFEGQTWKSGWLPPIVAIVTLAALHSRKLLITLLAAGAIFALANKDLLLSSLTAEEQESGGTRQSAWQVNWQFTREHLLLGMGPAGYAAYYMSYVPEEGMATHNNYLDVISQTGLVGLALFLWMLAATGLSARRVVKHVPRAGFEHGFAAGLMAGFAGLVGAMMLGDWFIPFAYTQGIAGYDYTVWGWLMIGLIMAMYYRYVLHDHVIA